MTELQQLVGLAEPAKPIEPAAPAGPAKPAKQIEPAKHIESAEPAEPLAIVGSAAVVLDKSAESETAAPIKPAKPESVEAEIAISTELAELTVPESAGPTEGAQLESMELEAAVLPGLVEPAEVVEQLRAAELIEEKALEESPVTLHAENTPGHSGESKAAEIYDKDVSALDTTSKQNVVTETGLNESAKPEKERSHQPEHLAGDVLVENDQNMALKEQVLTHDNLAGAGVVAAVVGSALASSSLQETMSPASAPAEAKTEELKPGINPVAAETATAAVEKMLDDGLARGPEPPTPESDADSALKLLAGEREALLRRLEHSTSTLQLSPNETPKANAAESIARSTEAAGPSMENAARAKPVDPPEANSKPADGGDAQSVADQSDRSLNSSPGVKQSNWFRALLSTIIGAIFGKFGKFGKLFDSLQRRGRTSQ
jgi:hypothetical protein